jgi:hypothetical protein
MGRIEDNESDRMERARVDAETAAKKAAETKRTNDQRAFATYVSKSQNARGENQKQEQGRSEQQNNAQQMLLARRGYKNNELSGQRLADGRMGNDALRSSTKARDMQGAQARGKLQRENSERSTGSQPMAVSGRGGQGENKGRSQGQHQRKEGAGGQPETSPTASFAVGNQAIAAMDGVGARASSGTAGAPGQLSQKEVIDELVARVQQGIEAKAGRPDIDTIRIELKDNILAGSTLTFSHEVGSGKVSLKVETGDEEVQRLLSASSTAQELSRALGRSELVLSELDVNDNKIIRS